MSSLAVGLLTEVLVVRFVDLLICFLISQIWISLYSQFKFYFFVSVKMSTTLIRSIIKAVNTHRDAITSLHHPWLKQPAVSFLESHRFILDQLIPWTGIFNHPVPELSDGLCNLFVIYKDGRAERASDLTAHVIMQDSWWTHTGWNSTVLIHTCYKHPRSYDTSRLCWTSRWGVDTLAASEELLRFWTMPSAWFLSLNSMEMTCYDQCWDQSITMYPLL